MWYQIDGCSNSIGWSLWEAVAYVVSMFSTMFTKAFQWINFNPIYTLTSYSSRSILILSSCLHLSSLLSSFRTKDFSSACVYYMSTPHHPPWLMVLIFGEEYKLLSLSLRDFLNPPFTSSILRYRYSQGLWLFCTFGERHSYRAADKSIVLCTLIFVQLLWRKSEKQSSFKFTFVWIVTNHLCPLFYVHIYLLLDCLPWAWGGDENIST